MPKHITISAKDLSILSRILKPEVLSNIQKKEYRDKFFLVNLDNISIGIYIDYSLILAPICRGFFYYIDKLTKNQFRKSVYKNTLDKHRNRNRDYRLAHPEYSVLDIAKQLIFDDESSIVITDDLVYDEAREYGDEIYIDDDLDF